MKILELKDLKHLTDNCVVTLGFYDGIHLGHQRILSVLKNEAKKYNYKSVVITFDSTVLSLFKMSNNIISTSDKLEYLNNLEIDYVLLLKTKDNFMGMSADEFKQNVLDALNTKIIVCGSDFSFARKKQGNIQYIKNNTNYELIVVEDAYINDIKISSTYIRNLLSLGEVSLANSLLFRPFSIDSNVIEGFKIGRTIGFKTANIEVNDSLKMLKHGVYFGKVVIEEKTYKAMINVGINPTVNINDSLKVEAHILDFKDDIYYKHIKVIFDRFYREEIKFEKLSDLKVQLDKDLENLKNHN